LTTSSTPSSSTPNDYDSYYLRSFILIATLEYEGAIEDLSRAIDLNPEPRIEYYLDRGWVYTEVGEYEAALDDYTETLALDPENTTALINRGFAYSKLGESQAAIDEWDAALALEPDNALALNNRAYEFALEDRELDAALADVNRAIELEADDGNYYDTRGYIHYKLGNFTSALADFNTALDMGLEYAYYGRGLVHEAKGETQDALVDYERFLEANPDAPDHSDDARQRLEALGG